MAEFDEDDAKSANAQVVRMQRYRDKYKKGFNLKALVNAMASVQKARDAAKDKLADLNAELDILRFEKVPEAMDEGGVETIRYDGIGRVSLTADTRVALPKAERHAFYSWCKSHKLGDLITQTINSSTLTSWVKTRIKQGKDVPGMLNVTPFTRASITKE